MKTVLTKTIGPQGDPTEWFIKNRHLAVYRDRELVGVYQNISLFEQTLLEDILRSFNKTLPYHWSIMVMPLSQSTKIISSNLSFEFCQNGMRI